MFRRCVHLPICQNPPGAQTGRVWQGHPPTSRKPKCKSRHTFCQRGRYQVKSGGSYKTCLWRLENQDQSRQDPNMWEPSRSSSARPLCNELQDKISVAGWDADLICGNICLFTFAGGYSMQLKRPTRQVISSGWVRTAGAQRSLRLCTRRRWQRELSLSYPSGSPSKVQRRALCIHKMSLFDKTVWIFHSYIVIIELCLFAEEEKLLCHIEPSFDHLGPKS